jgi:hypothetical protein
MGTERALIERALIGRPIPLSQLHKPKLRYPWLEILRSIPAGHAQETRIEYKSCKKAIQRLVDMGLIEKDEYGVATRTSGKTRRVLLVHYRKPKKHDRPRRMPRLKSQPESK